MRAHLALSAAFACLLVLYPDREAVSQAVTERTPNIDDGWTGAPGTVHFNFIHRFGHSGPPLRKVSSAPTFMLATPLAGRTLLGVRYATNSELVASVPNEWEVLARWRMLDAESGAPLDLAAEAAYNHAAESIDGQLVAARWFGPLRLLGNGRVLSDAAGTGQTRFAAGAGGLLRVSPSIALAGDVVVPFGGDDTDLVWGAGIQLRIPYTPHTLSLHASNTNTSTLQGSTLAAQRVRYGFEFTIPVTLARYFGRAAPTDAPDAPAEDGTRIEMRALQYQPTTIRIAAGTTVEWVNRDDVMHTVTADDGAFDSGDIGPGERWSRRFDTPGRYTYHCTPHPFMRGVVIVTEE